MTLDRNEAASTPATTDLDLLGLEAPEQDWLETVRRASRAPSLGRLGEYELLEEVNRGAQGVVYRASKGGSNGVVAIKRLLAGTLATPTARARFERELDTVTALRHPNIVHVIATESSERHPLLVMEWIDGIPIDDWADRTRVSTQRLEDLLRVFLDVCASLQHAHQRGVIHRDLKPSNILVDGSNQPHLLDFGLAKLTGLDAHQESAVTRTHDFLGTPAFAAPEQVRGDHDAVDVRTDVYALGVILFRMLTGRLPFDSSRGLADLLGAIQSTKPAKPSRCNNALSDDLDAIIAKAMAKDPERRYPSVDALSADLRRYPLAEPIEAQRGRRWYEMRTAVRRHRVAVCVLLGILVLVSAATGVLWRMYLHQGQLLAQVTAARDAEGCARRSAERQQKVLEELLSAAAAIGKGADLAVRRAWLDEAATLVEADLADDPSAAAAAHDAIGRTYQSLALYPEAEQHLRRALDLRRTICSGNDRELASSLHHFGVLLQDRNRFADAEPFLREALAMRRRIYASDHRDLAESLDGVGLILQFRKDYSAADDMHRQALQMYRRLFGDEHPEVARSLDQLGNSQLNQSRFADAERLFREALDIYREVFGEDHRDVAGTKTNLAKVLFYLGKYPESELLFREAVEANRRLLGGAHDNVAWGLHRLGVLQHANGEYTGAEESLREALDIYRRCFGDDDHYVALVLNSLGTLLMDRDDLQSARSFFDEALSIQERLRPAQGAEAVCRQNRVTEWFERAGDFDAALPLLQQITEIPPEAQTMEFVYLVRCMESLANIHAARGDSQSAEAVLRDALDMRRERLGPEHPDVGQSLVALAAVLRAEERLNEADRLVRKGIEIQRDRLGNDHPGLAKSLLEAASIAEALGDSPRAEEAKSEAARICERRE